MTIIETAAKELGVTAKQGTANNPRVLEYFQKVGHSWVHDDQTYWCAAFVGFVLETCGIPSTKRLNARSYLSWGFPTTKPVQGDVVVFWRDSVQSSLGHVSFFHHEDENTVYCLGGNQLGEKVSIQGYPKSRVLGYRSAINHSMPQAQPIKHMDTETTAGAVNVAMSPEPKAAKYVKFYNSITKEVVTFFTAEQIVQNHGPEFVFATVEEMLNKSKVETFNFFDNVPVGVGRVTE